ncbi:MAG: ribonuclease HIII [Candidatus Saccharicenans sp.]|nr:ribonuclease HIII [Candidatus Saccharicenans sp.]
MREQKGLFPPEAGHIGTDESGKGDFFGPLVVAGFFMPEGQEEVLKELGIRDSKKLSDNRVLELASTLRKAYTCSVVAIGPERYNELYNNLRNLNRILAWGHARAIENILEKVNCKTALTDQFGDEHFVRQALLKKGRNINLVQKTRAEEDLAVAAASILARAKFLLKLKDMSEEYGIELPKGASPMVEEVGVKLVKQYGPEILDRVAKKHFKTTQKVLELANLNYS